MIPAPLKPSLSEPVTLLRRVPIRENGEPLADFLALCPDLFWGPPYFIYRRETLLRRTVAEKLCEANRLLVAQGFRLTITEGWRAPHIQARMYRSQWEWWKEKRPLWSDAQLRRVVNRFTAPVSHPRVPPPHSTGGAVDLLLAHPDGTPCDHHSPYEPRDPKAFPVSAPGLSPEARATRARLADALTSVGITNYPSEYWHWSYGDQGWAYRGGEAAALYGPITPADWSPAPEDVTDAALEFTP